jgi:F-type H+-transporting ATPase subunit delta
LRNTVLARRYAKALFQLAVEKDRLEQIHKELLQFADLVNDEQQLGSVFFAQDISKKQKRDILDELLDGKLSAVLLYFLRVLLENGRASVFPTIVDEFTRLVDKYDKRIQATATTAVAMSETLQSRLKMILDKTFAADVSITNRIEPDILGGIIVQIEGQVLDDSLHNQLRRLQQTISAVSAAGN